MSTFVDKQSDDADDLLNDLSDSVKTVVDRFQKSEDHAIFVLGTKLINDPSGEVSGVHAYVNIAGYYEIIAEGLYSELRDEITNGNMMLFSMLRDVVRDLEDDFDIQHDDEITDSTPESYH